MSTSPTSRVDQILERALAAEERAEQLEARVADLKARLSAALDADPSTAIRALSWVNRAEQAERLLELALKYVKQRSIDPSDFPPGWVTHATAQLKSVEILKRDQAELAERPPDDDYWNVDFAASGVPELRFRHSRINSRGRPKA